MKKFAGFIYDHARFIIIAVIVLNIASAVSFIRFDLNADFLSFFSKGNPKADEYNALNEKYDTGESVSILIETDGSLLDLDELLAVYTLQQEIAGIDGISQLQSFLPPEMVAGTTTVTVDETLINSHYESLRAFIDTKYFMTGQFLNDERT